MENIEGEIWKDIPGYEGMYQASNSGKIKSVSRRAKHHLGGTRFVRERILKPSNAGGYRNVVLSKDGEKKTFGVHQLVAMAFLEHEPNRAAGLVVDHIDNDASNNNLSNLQVITHRQNCYKDKHLPGTYYHKTNDKWCAYKKVDGKTKYLGSFNTQEEANRAYLESI